MSKMCESSIREAAYFLWQNAGCPCGQEDYFWAMAMKQFNNCSCKKSTTSSSAKKAKSSVASSKKATVKKASTSANSSAKKTTTAATFTASKK